MNQARAVEEDHQLVTHQRAVRTVAGQAVDATDCLRLLEMLGLEPGDGRVPGAPRAEPGDGA
nr:hypothetical protein [Prauserella shujinwangii]